MATTVEPKTEAPAAAATPAAPVPGVGAALAGRNRMILIGGAAVAVVAAGIWFMSYAGKRKETFASEALTRAQIVLEQGNIPAASAELQKVADNFKGTAAAGQAILLLNQARMANNQSALAITGLQDYIKSGLKAGELAAAQGLLAAALENTGKPADAAKAYEAAAASAETDYLRSENLLGAGRAYLAAGNKDAAIKAYRTILEKYGKAGLQVEAEVRLAELTAGAM